MRPPGRDTQSSVVASTLCMSSLLWCEFHGSEACTLSAWPLSTCDTGQFHVRTSLNCVFAEKPREYLITLLERLKIAKVIGVAFPFFMENSNIVSMFEMMDSSGKGCISFVQYKEGQWDLDPVGHSVTFSSSKSFPALHLQP